MGDRNPMFGKEMNENTIFYSYMFKGGQAFGGHVNWDLIFEEYSKFHGKDVKKEFIQHLGYIPFVYFDDLQIEQQHLIYFQLFLKENIPQVVNETKSIQTPH